MVLEDNDTVFLTLVKLIWAAQAQASVPVRDLEVVRKCFLQMMDWSRHSPSRL